MIPHGLILKYVSEVVGDPRILETLKKFLEAGYIDPNGVLHKPKVGTPQGGVLSPLLANIVLHKLDEFMAQEKTRFDKGSKRRKNPEYAKLQTRRGKTSDPSERLDLLGKMRNISRSDLFDPNFRRLLYIRYADDFVALVVGDSKNAEYLRRKISDILKAKCGLILNEEKTIISCMSKKWNFLGAEIRNLPRNKSYLVKHGGGGQAIGNARTLVNAPMERIINKLSDAKIVRRNHEGTVLPCGLTHLMNLSHQEILSFYNSKLRGIINFYSFASNRSSLHGVVWLLKASCALTLAKKLKLRTMSKVFRLYGPNLTCRETEVSFFKPETLKAIHEFRNKKVDVDKLIAQT